MGIGEALLAEGVIVFLGLLMAKVSAEIDVWDLVTKHFWQGGGVLAASVIGIKIGQFWNVGKTLRTDVEHIKENMLTEEKLETVMLRLEDKFDEKYRTKDECDVLRAKKNGHIKGESRYK